MLALVGSNMLKEAILTDEEEEQAKPVKDATKGMTMVMLSVATSIDALAVGLSMSMLRMSIAYPAMIIGIVAGLFTIAGLHLGQRVARLTWLSTWAEITGGLVLFGYRLKYTSRKWCFYRSFLIILKTAYRLQGTMRFCMAVHNIHLTSSVPWLLFRLIRHISFYCCHTEFCRTSH